MKKVSHILLILFVPFLITVFGCTSGEDEIFDDDVKTPEGLGKLSDWHIEKGKDNVYDNSNGPLAITEANDTEKGAVMKVAWATSMDLRMCELWALLPEGYDYGKYDGVIFDVLTNVTQDILVVLRNPPNTFDNATSGTAWSVSEDTFVYDSKWWTITAPFDDAWEPGWGAWSIQDNLRDWLTDTKSKQKMLNLNPKLNQGNVPQYRPPAGSLPDGNALNHIYINLYKRIGLYKGTDPEDPKEICWIWNFGKEDDGE